MRLPASIEDITAEWLTSVMLEASGRDQNEIVCVNPVPLGGESSLQGAVYRADICVARADDSTEPGQLLIKLHDPEAVKRGAGQYRAEAYFYREISPRSGIRVPTTYASMYDEDTGRLLIIQEYLSGGRIGAAGGLLEPEDLERVLCMLAQLHSAWWQSPLLGELSGIRTFDNMRRSILDPGDVEQAVFRFLERFGGVVDPVTAEYYASLPVWIEPVEARLSRTLTLLHFDCQAKNIFLPNDPGQDPVLFDWALFAAGNPALDLATLLCFSVSPTERDRLHEQVSLYHQLLLSKGIEGYSFEELWRDFQLACVFHLVRPVSVAQVGSRSRDALVELVVPLLDSATKAIRAFDVLDELH